MHHKLARKRTVSGGARRAGSLVSSLLLIGLGLVTLAGPSVADGNNGTVKIDGWTLDHGNGNGAENRNEPHLDCQFDVEWYNFDANASSKVTFTMQSPTSDVGLTVNGPGQVDLDGDGPEGGDADGIDAAVPYTISFDGAPHPEHGYHVKLLIETTWANGSDDKYKVFWVEGCRDAAASVVLDEPGCEVGETLTYGAATHATYSGTPSGTSGPADYEVVATALPGHFFADGSSSQTYEGTLAGPRDDCGENTIPITPSVQIEDRCGTEDDSGPDFVAENDYWTAEVNQAGTAVVFTAKQGWVFPEGKKVSDEGTTWTQPFRANTDEPCEEIPQISFCHNENNLHEIRSIALSGFYHGHYLNAIGGETAHAGDLWPAFSWDGVDYPSNYDGDFDELLEAGCEPPPVECPNGDMNGPENPGCNPPPPPGCPTTHQDWNGAEPGCGNPPNPPNPPLPLEERVEGCDLTAYGDFAPGVITRTGQQSWVWVPSTPIGNGTWELGDPVWGEWVGAPYDAETYFTQCAEAQPADATRDVPGQDASCDLKGTQSWVDVYTTPYVWDAEARAWVPGTETGPVRMQEEFDPYSNAELVALGCVDVAGEQEEDPEKEKPEVEVKGEQAAQPGVPQAVDAGLASPLADGAPGDRNPMWLLAIGGGLGLMGAAGVRRRVTARR